MPDEEETGLTQSVDEAHAPDGEVPFCSVERRFALGLASLREFFRHLEPAAVDLDKTKLKDDAEKIAKRMQELELQAKNGKQKVEIVHQLIRTNLEDFKKQPDGMVKPVGIEAYENDQDIMNAFGFALDVIMSRGHVHRDLLNGSIIMLLVGYAEVLLSGLMTAFYKLIPDAIATEEKVLSIQELKRYGSIEEALDYVIARKVDNFIGGGIEDWKKFFGKNLNLDLTIVIQEWPSWCEVFQRRHALVHGDGSADSKYLNKVDWDKVLPWIDRPLQDGHLHVDDAYVQNAFDLFEGSGFLLSQSVWRKLQSTHQHRLQHLHQWGYEAMMAGRWSVTERLSAFGLADRTAMESLRLVFQFNYWLALKRQGRWTEIADEVRSFDTSAKHPRFALGQAALLEDTKAFFRILPSAELGERDLQTWPILDEMRADARFPSVISSVPRAEELYEDMLSSEQGNEQPESRSSPTKARSRRSRKSRSV